MAVETAFISSAQAGFESFREAARLGVERAGMHPVMAGPAGARTGGPHDALLAEVRAAEVFVLVLGARYGSLAASGRSPTEDEYDEALARGKPILVFVHDVDMPPEQRAFLERVRGAWDRGELYEKFATPEQLTLAIATALARWKTGSGGESVETASRDAVELARGQQAPGASSSGVAARIALVPTIREPLLGPLELEDAHLPEILMTAVRATRLASHSVGLTARVTRAGVAIASTSTADWITITIELGVDGTIVAQAPVRSTTSRLGSFVDPDKFTSFVTAAGEFAKLAWERIDASSVIQRAAVAASLPDSTYTGWGNVTGNMIRMSTASFDATAPIPAKVYQRGALGQDRYARELTAAMARTFADAGATSPAS